MRCGTQLIVKGNSQAKVLKYCGEPVTKSFRYGLRRGTYPKRGKDGAWIENERNYDYYGRTEVLIEDWIYNLGPNKFMRMIQFTNGIVEEIETLEYGYHENNKEKGRQD
jgi:hypothetical protein